MGSGLILGPLAYALTLEPGVAIVEVPSPPIVQAAHAIPVPVIPELVAPEPEVAPEAPVLDRLPFAFVTKAGLVLDASADPDWGTGSLRKHAGPGEFRAAKRADAAKIPAGIWAQRGRTFDLYGATGKVCTARLGQLSVVAQHDGPTDYDLFAWEGGPELDYEEFEADPPSARKIRSRVWKHPESTKWLVAEILGDGSCKGAIWARDAALPPVAVLQPSDKETDLTRRRVAELEASDAYAETRREYEDFRADLDPESLQYYGPWSTIETQYPAKVRTWRDAGGEARFVEVDFGEDEEGCGEGFYTRITSLDAVVDGAFEETSRSIEPVTIFDLDADGSFEMLYRHEEDNGLWLRGETLEHSVSIYQEWVCPC